MVTEDPLAPNTSLHDFESTASLNDTPNLANAGHSLASDYAATPYTIGGKTLPAPLVQIRDLKAHLCLLRAFKDLRVAVEANATTGSGKTSQWPELAKALDGPRRWAWFLELAVDRFHAWLRVVRPSSDVPTWIREELPPIDVLMVWHAYLLNPMWYAEDCDRLKILAPLRSIDPDIFMKVIVSVGDIGAYEASAERADTWEEKTDTPFNPLDAAVHASSRSIDCPNCLKSFSVPYLQEDGRGYAQADFSAVCTFCESDGISKERLAMLKFARDAVLNADNAQDWKEYGVGCYQAGTLRAAHAQRDTAVASVIKKRLREASAPVGILEHMTNHEAFVKYIVEHSEWSPEPLANGVLPSLEQSRPGRIKSAYTDDRPLSVDLVGAVSRQCSFIDKMHQFGWTNPSHFDDNENEVVLVHSISRYHAFLDLLSTDPKAFFVPTLDIDLAWHTHQLLGARYQSNCLTYVQRFIDHDDQVEQNHLSKAFRNTCCAWERRFGVSYSYCRCALPGTKLFSRLKAKLGTHAQKTSCLTLAPPQRPDTLGMTHASEHNAVFTTSRTATLPDAPPKQREMKVQQPRDRGEETAGEGDASSVGTGATHDTTFLDPVPFYVPVAGCGTEGASSAESASSDPSAGFSVGTDVGAADEGHDSVGGGGDAGCGGDCGGGACGASGCGGGGGD